MLVESLHLQTRPCSGGALRVRAQARHVALAGIGLDEGLAHATAVVQNHPMLAA